MTATVNISGTWSEKQKEANGFDTHADLIHANRILRVPFVGFAEFHQWKENVVGNTLTVRITAIEPAIEADGSDPNGTGKDVLDALDLLRKLRGKGSVDDIPPAGELSGQTAFDFDGLDDDEPAETRMGPDGEHQVPPPSGEEILAERAEKVAAEAELNAGVIAELSGGEPVEPASFTSVAEREEAKAARRKAKPTTEPFTPGGDA